MVIQPVAPRKAEPGAPCLVVKAFSTARLLGVLQWWFRKLSAPPPAVNYPPLPPAAAARVYLDTQMCPVRDQIEK